jgi:hypothetical protein
VAAETSLLSRYISSNEPVEQGPGKTVLTSSTKILGFKRKLNHGRNDVVKEIFKYCLCSWGFRVKQDISKVFNFIENHAEELRNKTEHYFSSLSTQVFDWVRSPRSESAAQPENLTLREEEELCELQVRSYTQHEIC